LRKDRAQEIERRSTAEETVRRIPRFEGEVANVERRKAGAYNQVVVPKAIKADLE
jgi:hypothetical protein